jgi:tetratricopeptide (TPR) repeat protein
VGETIHGQFDLAIEDYDKAIELAPRILNGYVGRAIVWEDKGDVSKAIADLDRALKIEPKSAWLFSQRGIADGKKKEFDRAIADFTSAIWYRTFNSSAFGDRGKAKLEKGDLDSALTDLNLAIWIDPDNASAYGNRARAFKLKHEFHKALLDYDTLAELQPVTGRNEAAWLLATCPDTKYRDGEKAVRYATEACELTAWHEAGMINTLSAALAAAGRFDEAASRLQQSIDKRNEDLKHPDDEESANFANDLENLASLKELDKKMMAAFKAGQAYTEQPE